MSADSGQGDSLCTPRRAQKCLFGPGGSSSKKSMQRSLIEVGQDDGSSGEDSDLGPMSPLALTDRSPSSCSSSSERHYISPFATPEKSSSSLNLSWDRLSSTSKRPKSSDHTSPFSELRKLTRAARYSPRRKLLPSSPNSSSNSPQSKVSSPKTPEKSEMTVIDEIIPETPQRSFGREIQNDIVETPTKSDSPEHRLITPLSFESKMIPLPRLHRRKSLSVFEAMAGSSPGRKENVLKRHAYDSLGSTGSKLIKTDENYSIPKARAALFQDDKCESKLKDFTLSARIFYNSSEKKENMENINDYKTMEQLNRRRSLPVQSMNGRRSLKRNRVSGINGGVSHGIRKPKPKPLPIASKKVTPEQVHTDLQESPPQMKNNKKSNVSVAPAERPPTPEADPNKRFFKTNRLIKQNNLATVTVNKKIKLNVSDGKLTLKQQNHPKHAHKRPKLADINFDATDLTVDEPAIQASIEENKVANILKVLEDDWADDDYDTMEVLTDQSVKNTLSPQKTLTILKNVTMSPASELSNMTSTMNIEDIGTPTTFENICFDNTLNNNEETQQKFYPLFTKGYSSNKVVQEIGTPKSSRGKGNLNWQLSTKGNGADNQYQLDAGQKRFGATQCTECGVVYQLGDPEDENAHLNYHNSIKTLKFPGWKTERVVMEDSFTSSRILLVEPDDSKQCWNKVSDILAVVDRDLGLADTKLSEYQNKKVYLYIRDKSVLGVLVAESIKTAHRMIPELLELDCCTAESTPAKCGINVVWTAMTHRKQGIATKLVDVLRAQFFFGYIMSLDDIAFSIPTPSGKIFAEKYTKTRNFKVYS